MRIFSQPTVCLLYRVLNHKAKWKAEVFPYNFKTGGSGGSEQNDIVELWKISFKMVREGAGGGRWRRVEAGWRGRGNLFFVLIVDLKIFISLIKLSFIFACVYIVFLELLCSHYC